MNNIKKFINLSYQDKRLFIEAVYFQFYYKLSLNCISFNKISKQFKKENLSDKMPDRALLFCIHTAVQRANKVAFWKNRCLVCSLAARRMIEKRGINSTIHLAIRFVDQQKAVNNTFAYKQTMEAHAWLTVGDFYVTPRLNEKFKEIYQF